MFIPGHLIHEEEKRRRERQQDRRIPLHAPQPPQQRYPGEHEESEDSDDSTSRGAIIIDLNDYSEVEE